MLDLGQLSFVRRFGHREGRRDRVLLEDQPDTEQLVDLDRAELGHPGTAAGEMLDQTLLGQRSERLAQGSAADREALPDLLLDQPLAGGELAGQDLVAELAGGHLHQARRV